MNREQILNATSHELDSLCARHILGLMGWFHQQLRQAYRPTENIEQAMQLLTYFRETKGIGWYIQTNTISAPVPLYTVQLEEIAGSCQPSLPLAIVIASLLAIAEMESQP